MPKKTNRSSAHRVAALFTAQHVSAAAMPEHTFWRTIEPYGWGTKTTDYKSIEKDLMKKLTPEQVEGLRETFGHLRGKLYKAIEDWEKRGEDEDDPDRSVGLGDDSFGDLIAHIIGMGHREYEAVLHNPKLAWDRATKGDFKESFSYALPGKDDFEKLSLSKYLEWAKKIADIYEEVLKVDVENFPWLPKMKGDLKIVVDAMKHFISTKNVRALLDKEKEIQGASANVEQFIRRINIHNLGDVEHGDALYNARNKWFVWNLLSDLSDYMT